MASSDHNVVHNLLTYWWCTPGDIIRHHNYLLVCKIVNLGTAAEILGAGVDF